MYCAYSGNVLWYWEGQLFIWSISANDFGQVGPADLFLVFHASGLVWSLSGRFTSIDDPKAEGSE